MLSFAGTFDGAARPRRIFQALSADRNAEVFADAEGVVRNASQGIINFLEQFALPGGEVKVERLVIGIRASVGHVLRQT